MKSMRALCGLYAITGDAVEQHTRLDAQVAAAISGGTRMIQYRDKSEDQARRNREAKRLAAICRARSIPFIINDDVDLAHTVGADGVHLGRDDVPIDVARRRLGPSAIIGASCYNQMDRARQAASAGADYLAFGRFFSSHSKPAAVTASIDLLCRARAETRLPLVAIGGITPENGDLLINAGADMLAVIHAVFGQADPAAAARQFSRLFDPEDP